MNNPKTSAAVFSVFLASAFFNGPTANAVEPQQLARADAGPQCELIARLGSVQQGSRKMVTDVAALNAANMKSQIVPAALMTQLQTEARGVNENAEEYAKAPATADPEAVFYLGKHMTQVRQLVADPAFQSARSRSEAADGVARHAEVMMKDVAVILAKVVDIKAEAARCPGPARS